MEINEHVLKISSAGVSLPEPLVLGRRYRINTEVDVTDIIERDNQDGTKDMIYKTRQTGNIEILDEGKRIIKAEGKKKVSQSIHGAIWYHHNQNGLVEDFNDYYERVGKKIAAYMPQIIEYLDTKN